MIDARTAPILEKVDFFLCPGLGMDLATSENAADYADSFLDFLEKKKRSPCFRFKRPLLANVRTLFESF